MMMVIVKLPAFTRGSSAFATLDEDRLDARQSAAAISGSLLVMMGKKKQEKQEKQDERIGP
jgi:hypothetical protein